VTVPKSSTMISNDIMNEAVHAVLDVHQTEAESADGSLPELSVTGPDSASLQSLGVDSMLVAEIIVELEQRLGTLLELTAEDGIETFEDLRAALRPATGM
jgi:acyl carrier protein